MVLLSLSITDYCVIEEIHRKLILAVVNRKTYFTDKHKKFLKKKVYISRYSTDLFLVP